MVREMLRGKSTTSQEQLGGKAHKKVKARKDNDGEGSSDIQPPKMKPLWKMKKWFKIKDDFRWVTMVGLGGYIRGYIGGPLSSISFMFFSWELEV